MSSGAHPVPPRPAGRLALAREPPGHLPENRIDALIPGAAPSKAALGCPPVPAVAAGRGPGSVVGSVPPPFHEWLQGRRAARPGDPNPGKRQGGQQATSPVASHEVSGRGGGCDGGRAEARRDCGGATGSRVTLRGRRFVRECSLATQPGRRSRKPRAAGSAWREPSTLRAAARGKGRVCAGAPGSHGALRGGASRESAHWPGSRGAGPPAAHGAADRDCGRRVKGPAGSAGPGRVGGVGWGGGRGGAMGAVGAGAPGSASRVAYKGAELCEEALAGSAATGPPRAQGCNGPLGGQRPQARRPP